MFNWDSLTEETVRNLSRLIQAETVNPPGNEEPAIRVVKDILENEGFTSQDFHILEPDPNRMNLVARLRGDGSQRPFLFSGHVDVVPVERERWTHDPFGGEVIEGMLWGRGALDMKGFLAMYLTIFMLARRQGLSLKRDLILAAIADEEAGFNYGSKFLVEKHQELIDAEYGINEAGALTFYIAGAKVYAIQVAEKGVCWLKMRATGQPGHGSMPHADNAVVHLAQAIERLGRSGRLPIHITPVMDTMIGGISRGLPLPAKAALGMLRNPSLAGLALKALPEESRVLFTALLSNTVSPTMLTAGLKANVIPSVAEANLDCRLLPGQTPQDALREILDITGDKVTLEPIMTTAGTSFPTEDPFYRSMEKATQKMDPSGVVVPLLLPGATDASEYQRLGMKIYGFTPGILAQDFRWTKLAHGHDERIPINAIRTGLPAIWEVVSEFCCA